MVNLYLRLRSSPWKSINPYLFDVPLHNLIELKLGFLRHGVYDYVNLLGWQTETMVVVQQIRPAAVSPRGYDFPTIALLTLPAPEDGRKEVWMSQTSKWDQWNQSSHAEAVFDDCELVHIHLLVSHIGPSHVLLCALALIQKQYWGTSMCFCNDLAIPVKATIHDYQFRRKRILHTFQRNRSRLRLWEVAAHEYFQSLAIAQ